MSKDYFKIIELLRENKAFLKKFINEPNQLLESYKISTEEKRTFLARSLSDVRLLGQNKVPKSAIKW